MTPQERLIELLVYIEQVEKMRRVAPFKVPDASFSADSKRSSRACRGSSSTW